MLIIRWTPDEFSMEKSLKLSVIFIEVKMFSILYYPFLILLSLFFMVLSALALLLCAPFDRRRRAVHELSRAISQTFFSLPPCWKVIKQGIEQIDPKQRYVIVLNHQSMVDIPMLYWAPLNFRWVAKRELIKAPIFGEYIWMHGDILIDRGSAATAAAKVLHDGQKWLNRGVSVAIFPEGTRSKDGTIHRFKSGAFNLAKEAGAPILPVVLDGTRTAFKPNGLLQFRHTFTIRVLKPIPAEEVKEKEIKSLMEETFERMVEAKREITGTREQKR